MPAGIDVPVLFPRLASVFSFWVNQNSIAENFKTMDGATEDHLIRQIVSIHARREKFIRDIIGVAWFVGIDGVILVQGAGQKPRVAQIIGHLDEVFWENIFVIISENSHGVVQ